MTSRYGIKILQLLGLKGVHGECVNFIIKTDTETLVAPLIFDALLDTLDNWDVISLYGIRSDSKFQHLLFSCGFPIERDDSFRCQVSISSFVRKNSVIIP